MHEVPWQNMILREIGKASLKQHQFTVLLYQKLGMNSDAYIYYVYGNDDSTNNTLLRAFIFDLVLWANQSNCFIFFC